MVETYYEVLGVARDASVDEIRSAYRERLKETHPDVSDAEDASRRTQQVIQAKDVLTDTDERERYDDIGHERYLASADASVDHGTVEDVADDVGAGDGPGAASGSGAGDAGAESGSDGGGSGAGPDGSKGVNRGTGGRTTAAQWWHERTDENGDGDLGAEAVEKTDWGETSRARQDGGRSGGYATAEDSWRTWDSDRSYNVNEEADGLLESVDVPDSGTIVVLLTIFFVYPVLLWGALSSPIPLLLNLLMGLLAVFIVAFLQSVPRAAVATFGFWTVVLPITLALGFGVSPVSLLGAAMFLGVALPLGFSLLVRNAVRY